HRRAIQSIYLVDACIVRASATSDIYYHAFQVHAVGACEARHILQHPPLHRLMATPTLKLQMQEPLPVVCQGHLEYLIDRDVGARQLTLEWTDCLHRSVKQPAGKVKPEGTDEPFEQTICFCHRGPRGRWSGLTAHLTE